MRLLSVDVSGFRGFTRPAHFDLDADVVIVSAPNGQGKTSFFDAVMWGLTGRVPRLGDDGSLISLFASEPVASVSVELKPVGGDRIRVSRSTTGESQILVVEKGDEAYRGPSAETQLISALWPDGLLESDPSSRLAELFARSTYLQQDVIRGFIDEDDPAARFRTIEGLVGVSRVTELQRQLETSRRAWNTETTRLRGELDDSKARLARVQDQLAALTSSSQGAEEIEARWVEWQRRARVLGIPEPLTGGDLVRAVENSLGALEAVERRQLRRLGDLRELSNELRALQALPDDRGDVETLVRTQASLEATIESLRARLADERNRLAADRVRVIETEELQEQRRVLAQLVLPNLGAVCPVCGQTHDVVETRQRLQAEIDLAPQTRGASQIDSSRVTALAEEIEARQVELAQTTDQVERSQRSTRERATRQSVANQFVESLGLPSSWSLQSVDSEIAEIERLVPEFRELRASGDSMALSARRLAEVRLRNDLSDTESRFAEGVRSQELAVEARDQAASASTKMIAGMQDAAEALVELKINELGPLLSRIYTRMDPHPVFRSPALSVRMLRRRGQLHLTLHDPVTAKASDTPKSILSSSQANALAIAIFLSLNMGFATLATRCVLMDDPLQSMDDVNLLGLVDLLRRTKAERQLVLGTHDRSFAQLLTRKLRPVTSNQSTHVIELDGWGRSGPEISHMTIPADEMPIRIAG